MEFGEAQEAGICEVEICIGEIQAEKEFRNLHRVLLCLWMGTTVDLHKGGWAGPRQAQDAEGITVLSAPWVGGAPVQTSQSRESSLNPALIQQRPQKGHTLRIRLNDGKQYGGSSKN